MTISAYSMLREESHRLDIGRLRVKLGFMTDKQVYLFLVRRALLEMLPEPEELDEEENPFEDDDDEPEELPDEEDDSGDIDAIYEDDEEPEVLNQSEAPAPSMPPSEHVPDIIEWLETEGMPAPAEWFEEPDRLEELDELSQYREHAETLSTVAEGRAFLARIMPALLCYVSQEELAAIEDDTRKSPLVRRFPEIEVEMLLSRIIGHCYHRPQRE